MPRVKVPRGFWDGEVLRPQGSIIYLSPDKKIMRNGKLWDADETPPEDQTSGLEDMSYPDLLGRAGDLDLDLSDDKSRDDLIRRIRQAESKRGTLSEYAKGQDDPQLSDDPKGKSLKELGEGDKKKKVNL